MVNMSKNFSSLLTKSEKKTITEKGSQQIKDLFNKYHDKLNKILSDYDKYMYYKFRVREFGKNDFQETNKIFWKDINHLDHEENPYLLVFKHLDTQKKKSFIFSKEEYSVEVNHITFKKILYDKTLTKDEIDFYDFIDNYTKEMIWGFHDEDGWSLLKKLKSELNTLLKSLSKKHITDFDKRLTKLSTKQKNTKVENHSIQKETLKSEKKSDENIWLTLSYEEKKIIEENFDEVSESFSMETYVNREYYEGNIVEHYLNPLHKQVYLESRDGIIADGGYDNFIDVYEIIKVEVEKGGFFSGDIETLHLKKIHVVVCHWVNWLYQRNLGKYDSDPKYRKFEVYELGKYIKEEGMGDYMDFFEFMNRLKNTKKYRFLLSTKQKRGLKQYSKILNSKIQQLKKKYIDDVKKEKIEVEKEVKSLVKSEFDLDENGELDIIEGENIVMDLIQKNQKEIGEFDHKIIQNLVKLNNFLNIKKENLTKLFNVLKKVETKTGMKKILESLKMSIENYQLLLVHSINMIVSIKTKEYVSYYELYENFDKMGVFNSEFENQLSKKLNKLSGKLSSIISSLDTINSSIISNEKSTRNSLQQLSYVNSSSFKSLQSSVTKELSSIRDGVGLNNLLTGINTYQLYTLNQNTKSLR